MNSPHSITSGRSFQARLVAADGARIILMIVAFGLLGLMWCVRRLFGGPVAATNSVFSPVMTALTVGIVLLVLGLLDRRRRARLGLAIPTWMFAAGLVLDVGIPLFILLITHLRSPRGGYVALSGPSLLIIPIVILLSALRLRPWVSMGVGLAAAVGHWLLVLSALAKGDVDRVGLPLALCYGVLLLLTGAAATVLAVMMRRNLTEAVSEAEAAERTAASLRSIEHELNIARDIQMGLLPSTPPTLEGFDIAGMARPATHAGGDYYDWQPLPDGRLLVVVADVTGHGIGPAIVMAVCRAYARATVPTVIGPTDFLERINDLICSDLMTGRFITMAAAVASPDGKVELLSAGHGPTLLRRADGRVEQFGGSGLPLGLLAGEQYNPVDHLQLEHGDSLVILTDGFMERFATSGEMYGTDRLAETIAREEARTAADIIRSLDTQVTTFAAGRPQDDDMTAVVLRRL